MRRWVLLLGLLSLSFTEPRHLGCLGPVEVDRFQGSSVRAAAEFEPVDGVLLAWDDDLASSIVELIKAAVGRVEVLLMVPDIGAQMVAEGFLYEAGVDLETTRFVEYEYDSVWTRDYGPIPIELASGGAGFVDTSYAPDRHLDDATPAMLAGLLGLPVFSSPLRLPGGNFMTNGAGLCVATEAVFDDNPLLDEGELSAILWRDLGCHGLVVLSRLIGEETGHVDMFAKFLANDLVLVGEYHPEDDLDNAEILDRNAAFLAAHRLPDGRPLRVARLPMPDNSDGQFRSYANSLVLNGLVLVPVYEDDRSREQAALATYRRILPPGTRIKTVEASPVIELGGAVHCLAQTIRRWPHNQLF